MSAGPQQSEKVPPKFSDADPDLRRIADMVPDLVWTASPDGTVEYISKRWLEYTGPDLVWTASPDGTVEYISKRWLEYTGLTEEQAQGWGWTVVIHLEDLDKSLALWRRALAAGIPGEAEARMRKADGTFRWFLIRATPYRDEQGRIVRWYGTNTDIDERKRAEMALAEAEKRFRLIADTAPVFIWMTNTNKLGIYVNKTWLDFTGRSAEEELGNGWVDGIHPEDLQACLETYTRCFDRRENVRTEYRFRRHDGEYRWILDEGVPRFNEDGSFAGYIGIGVDVTDRKIAERESILANDRLGQAMECGKSVGWEWDIKSGRDSWFGDLKSIFGMPFSNYVGQVEDFHRRVHPEDRALVARAVNDAMQGHKTYSAEFRVVRLDGSVRWIAATGKFHYSGQGKPERMLGMAVDITDRKNAEIGLAESEERFRLAAHAGKMFAYAWDPATDAIVRSGEPERILGDDEAGDTTRQHILGKIHPDDLERVLGAIAEFSPEKPHLKISFRMLRSDGSVIWVERHSRASFDKQGKIVRINGMIADITPRKWAEEALAGMSRKLIEAQEQERTRIARDLHDDISQRLALLSVELEGLREALPDSTVALQVRVDELQKRTAEISTDVQALSHELHSPKLEYLGIVTAMKSFCREFDDRHKVKVDFTHDCIPRDVPLEISTCLFRVLQESLHNASKHSGVRYFEVKLQGLPNEVRLTVRDSGAGFDMESASSTRGLGLISMRERVNLVKGVFSVTSKPQSGTEVSVRVPLTAEAPAEKTKQAGA